MKIYYLKIQSNKMRNFVRFCNDFNISVYITWSEDNFFGEKIFFATVTDEPDAKITMEEKAKLISDNFSVIKTEVL